MKKFQKLKEEVYRCNLQLPKNNLAIYTFGNVSGIDRERGVFAIKPSGIPYEELTSDKIVIVDLEGNLVEGNYNPSSDTKTHVVLYKHFPNIGGIVHTHSTYATSWAQAKQNIPILGTTHADHLPISIPCTELISDKLINSNYEESTGFQILKKFKHLSYKEVEMVLVASHGPFTWGQDPEKAVYNATILEELAKMAFLSITINPDLQKMNKNLINKHYFRKHGNNAYYGQKIKTNK